MKIILTVNLYIIIIYTTCFIGISQKYDNTWLLGYSENGPAIRPFGTTTITFTNGKIDTQFVPRTVDFFHAFMSISDYSTGDLILYSNGCNIYGADDKIISNGQGINPGFQHNAWCTKYGYSVSKAGCFIPCPDQSRKEYYLIHRAFGEGILQSELAKLYYTLIVKENDIWKVKEKNKILLDQQLSWGGFELVKHANGKDWWILSYDYPPDSSFTFLLTENGIQGPFLQYLPLSRGGFDYFLETRMTPDGEKYIRIDFRSGLSVLDFDRQTGKLSHLQYWPFWITNQDSIVDYFQAVGISVSPNSRYLYISSPYHLWQFDLHAQDIATTRILIDTFDGFKAPFGTTFFEHQLAPDGKIYLDCTNGELYMHTIHEPNLPGKACNFKQHDILLPTYNAGTIPYFPNYYLGSTTSTSDLNIEVSIYPNPVLNTLNISAIASCYFTVVDLFGNHLLTTDKKEIDVSILPSGLYFLTIDYRDYSFGKTYKFIKL